MDLIFHEKQEGSLCAQHCLNALLQGEYFTAVELGQLAQQMDDEERRRMEEGGMNSEEYHHFLQQPSGNMDDSGYFSVQVIASALKVWNLEIIPYSSQHFVSQSAQKEPTDQRAYICNYKDHWFTIRKLGQQWFNLNSLLSGPDLISNTYLSIFLAQLRQEGYAIFIVIGVLPSCEADDILKHTIVTQVEKVTLKLPTQQATGSAATSDEDQVLREALKQSLEASDLAEQAALEAALQLSLNENKQMEIANQASTSAHNINCDNQDEEEMLKTAIKLSMEEPS